MMLVDHTGAIFLLNEKRLSALEERSNDLALRFSDTSPASLFTES
ncbi:hypothetical protein [Bradyrhizobium sp.]